MYKISVVGFEHAQKHTCMILLMYTRMHFEHNHVYAVHRRARTYACATVFVYIYICISIYLYIYILCRCCFCMALGCGSLWVHPKLRMDQHRITVEQNVLFQRRNKARFHFPQKDQKLMVKMSTLVAPPHASYLPAVPRCDLLMLSRPFPPATVR